MGGAPCIADIFRTSLVVGVGDVAASNNPQSILTTYALGSCVGLILFDPVIKVGGLLHCVLPDSTINPQKAYSTPGMFADTGFNHLLFSLESFGAKKPRLRSFMAGGARIMDAGESFRIGERNIAAITQLMLQSRIPIHIQETGGAENRSLFFHLKKRNDRLKNVLRKTTVYFMISTSTPPFQSLASRTQIVNIGDVAASKEEYYTLSAYGLGASVGIIVFDPERKIGGLAHVMLPSSKADPIKGQTKPGLFVDTAIRLMVHNLADENNPNQHPHLCAFIVGGARSLNSDSFFDLPENLLNNTRSVLAQSKIPIIGEDTGGQKNRTVHLHLNKAFLEIQSGLDKKEVSLL